jgi:hypothetical protein
MSRKSLVEAVREVMPPAPPVVLHPTGVYTAQQVRDMLGLRQSSLRREIRDGRLRVNKRCGKYFFLGELLIAWLRGGEHTNGKKTPLAVRCASGAKQLPQFF